MRGVIRMVSDGITRGKEVTGDYSWHPAQRFGALPFCASARPFVEAGILTPLRPHDARTGWTSFSYHGDSETIVHVDSLSNEIEGVGCYDKCFLNGVNVIGLDYKEFEQMVGCLPDESSTEELTDGPERVHEFYDLGAQVWVKDGIVVACLCNERITD